MKSSTAVVGILILAGIGVGIYWVTKKYQESKGGAAGQQSGTDYVPSSTPSLPLLTPTMSGVRANVL